MVELGCLDLHEKNFPIFSKLKIKRKIIDHAIFLSKEENYLGHCNIEVLFWGTFFQLKIFKLHFKHF